MDLEGFEPSPATMTGCYAAVTPQAHHNRAYGRAAQRRRINPHFLKRKSFLLGMDGEKPPGASAPRFLCACVTAA